MLDCYFWFICWTVCWNILFSPSDFILLSWPWKLLKLTREKCPVGYIHTYPLPTLTHIKLSTLIQWAYLKVLGQVISGWPPAHTLQGCSSNAWKCKTHEGKDFLSANIFQRTFTSITLLVPHCNPMRQEYQAGIFTLQKGNRKSRS